jgi:large conductance mechanosensitive channel
MAMGLAAEFREFAMKGNVVDLAVGVIIGGAFGKIVSSMVDNIIMPVVGKLMGGVNFADLAVSLGMAPDGKTAVLLKYGAFIQSVVDFLIVAAVIFVALKGINSLKRPAPPAAAAPPPRQEVLLEEIRDLLARR